MTWVRAVVLAHGKGTRLQLIHYRGKGKEMGIKITRISKRVNTVHCKEQEMSRDTVKERKGILFAFNEKLASIKKSQNCVFSKLPSINNYIVANSHKKILFE
jgi:hypothetical protein